MVETLSQPTRRGNMTCETLKFRGLTTFKTIGVVLMATMLVSVWPGCKDNTAAVSSGRSPQRSSMSVPTAFRALPAPHGKLVLTDPTRSNLWAGARWYTMATSQGTPSTTQAAAYYTAHNLYIAVNTLGSPVASPGISLPNLWQHSCAEVWLDTTAHQTGMNFYEIVVAPNGRVNQVWHKSGSPPRPLADGQVNFDHPFASIPWKTPGLVAKTWSHLHSFKPGWSAVLRIPLGHLPRALACACKPGSRYRINVLRYKWHHGAGSAKLIQSSLFPVAPGCQPFAPYRMGRLVLGHSGSDDLALLTRH